MVNGTTLHYFDEGEGLPILFIHPPVIGGVCFAFQVQALQQQYRTIGFDIRGQGKSSPSRKRITYSVIVEDMVALLDHLKIDKAVVCGYSTGATVALEAVLGHPERFPAIILVSGMSEVSDFFVRSEIQMGVQLAKMRAKSLLSYVLAFGNTNNKKLRKAMYEAGIACDGANTEQYFEESLTHNCSDQLHEIQCPVLLVYGQKDQRFRPYGRLLKSKLPQAEVVQVPAVSHQLPGKAPDALNRAITEFMEKITSRT